MENTTQQPSEAQKQSALAIIDAKRKAWGEMGVQVHQLEASLQAQKEAIKLALIVPKSIDDIAGSETALKTAKSATNEIVINRKKYTSKFDELITRLMIPEKEAIELVKANEAAIIAIKKQHEAEQQKQKQIEDAKIQLKKQALDRMVEIDTSCRNLAIELVNKAYNHALDNDVKPDAVKAYIEKCEAAGFKKYDEYYHLDKQPKPSASMFLSLEEAMTIWNENYLFDLQAHKDLYSNCLHDRFSDYELAFQNKERAKEIARQEAEAKAAEIAQEKAQADTMNMLTTNAEVFNAEPVNEVKALKKSYEIDMPDTIESMLSIFAAFAANRAICEKKTSTKNWLKFNAESAGKTLAKLKSDDNSLDIKGIIFKEVAKL